MRAFGFLSFGHYGKSYGSQAITAADMIKQAVEIGVGADELGVNGAYFRVHHFARQQAAPIPLLTAIAARTKRIEVGTGVIDMRYENPLYLAEEAAALDVIADGRTALGISRGSPETALRGYETFGYTGSTDPRGADIAREKFDLFLKAIAGEGVAKGNPGMVGAGQLLPIEPQSPGLRDRIWWGSATRETAEWTGRMGLNLMSSTLLTEDTGQPFDELQAEQIRRFRDAYRAAGHTGAPRVSVSRSIIPIMNETDAAYFGHRSGAEARDGYGIIDGFRATSGRTYADTPDRLVEQLKQDQAIALADTLMLTIPSQLGPEYNLHILESFAKHVAPELGWKPNWEGPVTGDPIA
ncbi:LLM class flavin-dependent oxidoreductase [Paracoccus pacificus]|uniref:LLM class flavin-dependent oxidoreductase n=1 Tax=Paracoccus pacificus TaxID=1463598 RepID=A0ABW4RA60_9RHOB